MKFFLQFFVVCILCTTELQAQNYLYIGPTRYTATGLTVYNIDMGCYGGTGIQLIVNGNVMSNATTGFCFFGVCLFNFPFGSLRVGDQLKVRDGCGNESVPITILDDFVYIEVPSGSGIAGNGIGPTFENPPFSILSTPIDVGKCSPVNINGHALHPISVYVGTNDPSTYTSGVFKLNGSPIASNFITDSNNYPGTTASINANGSVTYVGGNSIRSTGQFSGRTPLTFEYQHNGVLPFDVQEITFGPLGYRMWNNGRVQIKEYKYDGSLVLTDINQDITNANFKVTFNTGTFKLFIDDTEVYSINRSIIYSTSNGTISNTAELAYGTGVTWTPTSSGRQWVGAWIDGVRFTRQEFNVVDDIVINPTVINVGCFDASSGSIVANVTGGLAPLMYSKDNVNFQSSNTFAGLPAGTYTLYVKDASGCTNSRSGVVVGQNAVVVPSISAFTNTSCVGTSNGTITASATGGVGPFQYSIDGTNFGASSTFTGLGAGNYTITVRDVSACDKTITQTIGTTSNIDFTSQQSNITCFGGNDGTIAVTQTGTAAGAVLFSNDGGVTFNTSTVNPYTFSALPFKAGGYAIVIKDDVCQSATQVVTVSQPTDINIGHTISNVSCFGSNNGTVTLTASGGMPATSASPYTFSSTSSTTGFGANPVFPGLGAGFYRFWVKDGAGCVKESAVLNVLQPTDIAFSVKSKIEADCFGNATGTVNLSAFGGMPTFSFSKDNNTFSADSTFAGLAAGNYTFYIKDGNACSKTVTTAILQPTDLTFSSNITNALLCNGDSNGAISLTAAGGAGSLTFSKDAGVFTSLTNYTGLGAGTFNFKVKDANACIKSLDVSLIQNTAVDTSSTLKTVVTCFGGSDANITIVGSGGTGNYTYSKDNSTYQTSNAFTGFMAGNQLFYVKDGNGCTKNVTVTFSQRPDLIVSTSESVAILCYGGSNGQITVAGSGGTLPYSFSADGSSYVMGGDFSGLVAGSYSFWIRDANGCTKTTTARTIAQPPLLVPSVQRIDNVACFQGVDGAIQLQSTGGTGSITYAQILPAVTNNSGLFNNLGANTYNYNISDANGCLKTISAAVSQPAQAFSVSLVSSANLTCFQNNTGQISVLGSGGTVPYRFSTDNTTFGANPSFGGLAAGNFTIFGQDANGCSFNLVNNVLTQPTDISIQLLRKEDINCEYGQKGEFLVGATGSNGGFSYAFTGIDHRRNVVAPQSNATGFFQNLNAGNYLIQATDVVGCVKSFPVTLTPKNSAIRFDVNKSLPTTCLAADGSISLSNVTGGNPAYSYSISTQTSHGSSPTFSGLVNGNYFVTVADNLCSYTKEVDLSLPSGINATYTINPISCEVPNANLIINNISGGNGGYTIAPEGLNFSVNRVFNNLPPGLYAYTIQDDPLSCRRVLSTEIKEQNRADLQTSSITKVACFGGNNGAIQVIGNNNMGPFTFAIDSVNGTYTASGYFANLTAGNYRLFAKNRIGCIDSIRVLITEPTQLSLVTSQVNNLCNGDLTGQVDLFASGGVEPYSYKLNTTSYQPQTQFKNLVAAGYMATVKDANDCLNTQPVILTQPTLLTPTAFVLKNVSCYGRFDAEIEAGATGGTAPYAYSIDAGNNYFDSGIFKTLTKNNYTITVKDKNGCAKTVDNLRVTMPDSLVASIAKVEDAKCNGSADGAITLAVTGGTKPYDYTKDQLNFQRLPRLDGFKAGGYVITVKDAQGCTNQIGETVKEPLPLLASAGVAQDVSCFGGDDGVIRVLNQGGTAPFMYAIGTDDFVNENEFIGLKTGNYTFKVRDNNGCLQNTTDLFLPQATLLVPDFLTVVPVSCFKANDGLIELKASGGTAPYKFNGQVLPKFENLKASRYVFVVSDNKGCQKSIDTLIVQPDSLVLTPIYKDTVTCYGKNDGLVELKTKGGNKAFNFSIDNKQFVNAAEFGGLKAGDYSFYVVDEKKCAATTQIKITQPDELIIAAEKIQNPLCYGEKNGFVQLVSTGGNGGNIFSLDNSITNPSGLFKDLNRGDFLFDVKDTKGCKAVIPKVTLSWPEPLTTSISKTPPRCFGEANGSIEVQAGGGSGSFGFTYNQEKMQPNSSKYKFEGLNDGFHLIEVKDQNGCIQKMNINLTSPTKIEASDFSVLPKDVCKGQEVELKSAIQSFDIDRKWYFENKIIDLNNPQKGIRILDNGLSLAASINGKYTLELSNSTGCLIQYEYNLANNQNSFEPNFLIPTKTNIGDTVVCLDITKPVPSRVEWTYPSRFTPIQENNSKLAGQFYSKGVYQIKMKAANEFCENIVIHEIEIFEIEKNVLTQTIQEIIKNVFVSPNPTRGKINILVELNREVPVQLEIVRNVGGQSVYSKSMSNSLNHSQDVDLNEMNGVFILNVIAGNERRTVRILLNR